MSRQEEVITDEDRLPLLTPHGRRLIETLREHAAAPIFSARSGNRLTREGLEHVKSFAALCTDGRFPLGPDERPDWIDAFVLRCHEEVPFYRRRGAPPDRWEDVPRTCRGDLSRDPCLFVPDSVPAQGLIKYTTAGTTGHPLLVPSRPAVAGCYIPLLELALRRHNIALQSRRGKTVCVLIGYQRSCFTYVSVTPLLDDAAFVKINLHPDDWREPSDRQEYLDACAPEIITGDPISFSHLADLPMKHRPRALISTAMTLLPGLRRRLEERFGCPVVDVYSMNESGPVAASLPDGRLGLLQPRLHVEILDDSGRTCPVGTRGELTLTGGFNDCLPLLRYRTGDYAAVSFDGPVPALVAFEGRPPTVFRTSSGGHLNNIEITHALQALSLPQFTLHQCADDSFRMRVRKPCSPAAMIRAALLPLLGADALLDIEEVPDLGPKVLQYSSDTLRE